MSKPVLLLLAMFALLAMHLPAMAAESWIGSWGAAPQPPFPGPPESYRNQTLRLIVHASAGGPALRIRLSNLYGDTPLRIDDAHVARRSSGADIDPATDRAVTFQGRTSTVIPPHAMAVSDPVDLAVPALSDLAISLFLPDPAAPSTVHVLAMQTSYVSTGDATAAARFPVEQKIDDWPFLSGVDVAAAPGGSSIVAFGDSTVDGDGSTPDANARWPDRLAARLQAAGRNIGVLNEGMIGNRLLRDSPVQSRDKFGRVFGQAGLARFDRDVLAQPGIRAVILRIGGNDIGFPGAFSPSGEKVTAQDLIAGYRQLVARARRRGLRVIGTTMVPFEGAKLAPGFSTPDKEAVRQQVNDWLRHAKDFDALIDFDAVLHDPDHPARLLPQFDSGDHLHPNDAGYRAVADSVPLDLFGK